MTDATTKICSFLGIGMDVFKGLVNKDTPKKDNTTDSRPWLSDEQFDEGLQRVGEGEGGVYEKIINTFKMKKVYKEQLDQAHELAMKLDDVAGEVQEEFDNMSVK